MAQDELPCLDLLAATPAILHGLLSEISGEDTRWKPAPDNCPMTFIIVP